MRQKGHGVTHFAELHRVPHKSFLIWRCQRRRPLLFYSLSVLLFFFLYPSLLQNPVPHLLSLFLPFCLSVIPLLYKCHLFQIISLFHKHPFFLTFIQMNYFLYLTIICVSAMILSTLHVIFAGSASPYLTGLADHAWYCHLRNDV
jgi:hypothetical protein